MGGADDEAPHDIRVGARRVDAPPAGHLAKFESSGLVCVVPQVLGGEGAQLLFHGIDARVEDISEVGCGNRLRGDHEDRFDRSTQVIVSHRRLLLRYSSDHH